MNSCSLALAAASKTSWLLNDSSAATSEDSPRVSWGSSSYSSWFASIGSGSTTGLLFMAFFPSDSFFISGDIFLFLFDPMFQGLGRGFRLCSQGRSPTLLLDLFV